MIDNNTTEEKYISQVVLPPIEEGDNERLYLIKDRNARDNIETLQSDLTSLNEEVNMLDTKVDNIKIPDISNLVTTDNLNNKVSNLITRNELDNTYVKWSALTSNYSNNFILNNSYAHTTNGIIDNATVDYTDVNDLYNNYAHTNANGTIDNANISYANINNLYNNYAHINNGEIDNATIDHSNINNLNTNYAHINNGTIDNANIDYANVNNLENNYAHIENGIIDNATINYSNINELENNYAHITNGKIDNATIDQAKVNNLSSNYAHITDGKIDNATINYAKIDELNSNYAHINNGIIDNASINYANINDLETNYAHITDGTIDNATISYANIDNLENNYAHINNGVIDNAKIDYGDVRFLDSHYAHISEGIIDNALIGYANVEQLDSHYAEIDMANVNNAWIENGVIKDAAISDAQIAGVSANKITAGTIDAANVNVINLRADNLTVTKINGQPVIGGYTLVNSSISGYSEKNPNNEGWYEFNNNTYRPTDDTTVDSNKNYYTTSESVSLYDQNTINDMFSNINERIDSQIETWTVDTVPLLNNEPAVRWTTDDEKDEHIGDICYVVNAASDYDGFTYRFAHDNTSDQYSWVLIQDNQVTAALGRITNLESFNNQLVHWEDATDEGVITVRGRITELSGRIDNALSVSDFETFEQTTFKEVTDTIDEQTASITDLTTIIDNNGLTENTTIINTVNTVSQKANSNESKISSLTTALGTNADGTSKENDIIHQVSDINQNLDSIITRVGKTEASLKGTYATSSTAANVQNKEATIFPAITNFELYKGAAITVKFINENTISNPTLNINSSGAKPIKTYSGANLSEVEYAWRAGSTMTFVYDETNWCIQDSTELTRIKNAESSITQTANSITSLVANNETYTAPDGTTKENSIRSAIKQNADNINLRVEKAGVIAAINASIETDGTSAVKISADKVNIEGAAIFSGNGRLSQDSLNNTYASTDSIPSDISDLTDTTNIIPSDLSDLTDENSIIPDISDKADKSSAIAEEQIIYIQAVRDTNSINAYPSSATTTSSYWITQTGESIPSGTPPNSNSGQTPRWTLKRPSYQKNYPIVFVAKQRKTVSGIITCTTPIKDDTTTIIDGGHITTGTIDASQVTVNNIHADNITVGTINGNQITNGAINFDKLDSGVKDNINTISDAATSALNNLATIENVVDTLTWVTEHGTMTSTTDTAIDITKVYFILDNNGDYTVGNNKYSIVQEPNVSNLSNYYELTIDKSVQNYIATHLSLTNEGLWLTPMATESNGCKVLVATGSGTNYPEAGTYIIDRITDSDNNTIETVVAQFTGTGISFAEDRSFHIGDESAFIHFGRDNNGIGHINIGGSQVTIGGNTTLQQLLNKYNSTITSNDISVSKSGNTATITIGNDSVNIVDGAAGEDGAQILGITTAPSSYTTTTNGFTPTYRIALSTVKTQSGASKVKIGDILAYSYYHYPVGYVDTSYVYCGVRNSIRGQDGATGGRWYAGTSITGVSTASKIFSGSGIASAVVGDMYLNTSTQNTYRCTTAGAPSTARWVYVSNIKGNSVTNVEHQYYLSTSSTIAPLENDNNWKATPDPYVEGHYYWERWKIVFSAADTQYTTPTLAEEITSAWAAIEKSNEEINLRATKTEMYQTAQPNLAPIGSVDFSNIYNINTNPNGYWRTALNSINTWFTQLDDGWIHVYIDNSEGIENISNLDFSPDLCPSIIPGNPYTILTEIRNNSSLGTDENNTNFYLDEVNNNQFWGNVQNEQIDNEHITTSTNIELLTCGQTNTLYSYRLADTSHIADINEAVVGEGIVGRAVIVDNNSTTQNNENNNSLSSLFCYNFQCAAGSILDFDFRMSVYEGIYNGPYKPYSGSQLYSSQAELKVQADRIGMIVANDNAESNLQLTADAMNYIGDHVEIKGTDGTSTVIRGGQIQTGSLSIGSLDSAAQSATLNSNISVGGRNLLMGTADYSTKSTYNQIGITVSSDTFGGTKVLVGTWSSGNMDMGRFANAFSVSLQPDSDYTLSFWAKATAEVSVASYLFTPSTIMSGKNSSGNTTTASDGAIATTLSTEWERYWVTWHTSTATSQATQVIAARIGTATGITTEETIYLAGVKFEQGNKATDWTPAPEDLEAYADQTAYLTAKPNLAPIGSVEFSDVYDATTNPDGYWQSAVSAWFTQLNDGWIHVYKDNSSGASSATGALNTTLFRPSASPSIFAGKVYTILTEIRNNASTGTGTNDFYLQQISNNQFWGDTSGVVIDNDHVTTTTTVSLLTCGQSYVLRSYRIADTDHLTAGTPSPEMFRYNFRVEAGSVLNFDFRMSVYEGIYDGPYKSYSGTQLFATQKDASDAAKTATSYVTDINSNGITVHPSRSDYETSGGRAVINGDGLTVYLGSDDVASYGASARIGKPNSDRVTVDSTDGITIYKSNQNNQGIKKLQTTTNGIDIYGDDGITNIASFGEITRIGRSSQGHAQISENGFNYFQGNENVFTVEAYGEQVYELGIEYGNRVIIPAGENAQVSGTYDSQIVLEEPKCVYQLETGLWKEIDYSSNSEESIYYNGINSSTTADSSIETWGFNVYNNTSSPITAVIAQVFDRRPISTRIGKNNSDRVTVDPTNGITIYKGNNKKLQTTTNGIDIYQDSATPIASFGSTTTIGANNNVQVIIESDGFEIKNQLGNRFFNIEGRSSNQTIDRSPIEVCEWSDKDEVNEDSVTITDSNIIASTASNFTAPTFNIVVNNDETLNFDLDSSQVNFEILTNQINISLTASGIAFIQDKMTNTYSDEYTEDYDDESAQSSIITGTDFPCVFYVTYSRTVADKAILDFTGNQTIKGSGGLLTLSNDVSDTTSTLIKVKNEQTNKTVNFGIGSNGVTRGVWDETAKNWIICHDANNKVVIQGPNFTVASTGDVKANAITMTGALNTPILNTKNPNKAGNYRTTDGKIYTLTPFNSYDKNGARIGYSSIVVVGNSSNTSVNRIYRSFAVTNLKTNKIAAIYINNYDNGTTGMTFAGTDFAKNTRHSLGANSAGIWPRSLGGTGVTEIQSDTITVDTTNATASVNGVYHNGIVCTVYYCFSLKSALAASTTALKVGTVPSGYRPTSTFYGTAYCNSSNLEHPNILFYIGSNGEIKIMNRCGGSISTSVIIRITATYVI